MNKAEEVSEAVADDDLSLKSDELSDSELDSLAGGTGEPIGDASECFSDPYDLNEMANPDPSGGIGLGEMTAMVTEMGVDKALKGMVSGFPRPVISKSGDVKSQ